MLWIQFAAVTAVLAVQVGLSPCTAGEITQGNGVSEEPQDAIPSFFGNDSFFNFNSMLQQSMSALMSTMSMLGQLQSTRLGAHTSLSLSLMKAEPKSCQVNIMMGGAVSPSELKVTLCTDTRRVGVKMHVDEAEEERDPESGYRRSSSSIHLSSALTLPEKCIATPAALSSNLIGYMVRSPEAQDNRGMIIFPSRQLLEDYSDMGLLPRDIVDIIDSGNQRNLANLSSDQLCLAAGFTNLQCEKLGNKKPEVASVAPVDSPNSVPIPLYDANLELLE